jgi:hypothetical protein
MCDNKDKLNHLKIIQRVPERHDRRAQNQETTENSHNGHCTRTSESTLVVYEIQNIQHGQ